MEEQIMNFKFDLQRFANAPSAENLLLGAGKTFLRRWERGVPQVRRHLGNVPKFTLTPTIEKIQKFSSMDASRELYAEAVKSQLYKVTLEINEITPYNLALALYGEEGVEVQEGKPVTDDVYDVTLGAPISIPYRNITDVVISPVAAILSSIGAATSYAAVGTPGTAKLTSGGTYSGTTNGSYFITITKANAVSGTITDAEFTWQKGLGGKASAAMKVTGSAQALDEGVTVAFAPGASGQDLVVGEIYEIKVTAAGSSYVAGKDFTLDKTQLRAGIIPIPETSNIPDGSKVKVSYTVPDGKYPKVMGGSVRKIEGDLLFIGDPSMGRAYTVEIWHVTLTPSGDIGLIGDDWGSFTLEMTVMADRVNHPDAPFFEMVNA
jgi:hypothetical protein